MANTVPTFTIAPASSAADVDAIKAILVIYDSSNDPSTGPRPELASLQGDYGPPSGALLLARSAPSHSTLPPNISLGMVAYKTTQYTPLGCRDMIRLFVSLVARGMERGQALVLELLKFAKEAGYEAMRMGISVDYSLAVALYEGVGFERRERYNPKSYEGIQAYDIRL